MKQVNAGPGNTVVSLRLVDGTIVDCTPQDVLRWFADSARLDGIYHSQWGNLVFWANQTEMVMCENVRKIQDRQSERITHMLQPELGNEGDLPAELQCPLSGTLFRDPVLLPNGLSYERGFIEPWLKSHYGIDPETGVTMLHAANHITGGPVLCFDVISNLFLTEACERFRESRGMPDQLTSYKTIWPLPCVEADHKDMSKHDCCKFLLSMSFWMHHGQAKEEVHIHTVKEVNDGECTCSCCCGRVAILPSQNVINSILNNMNYHGLHEPTSKLYHFAIRAQIDENKTRQAAAVPALRQRRRATVLPTPRCIPP